MSDISYEQMKVLFENLADRIDKTGGDKATQDALDRVHKVMNDTLKSVEKMTRQGTADSKAIQKVLNDFVVEFSRNAPRQSGPAMPRQPYSGHRGNQYGGYRRPGVSTRNHVQAQPDDRAGDTFIRRKKDEQDRELQGIRDGTKAHGESNNSILRFKKSIDSVSDGLTGWLGKVKDGNFLNAALGGGAAGAAIGLAKDRAESYRTMIQTGEGSFSSIQQMNNSANDALMSVEQLADAMKSNQGARLVGGQGYANIAGLFTKNNANMANLGLNIEQSQTAIQDYLELQKNQGTLKNMTDTEMVAGITRIVKSSEQSAHILGITREDALKAAKEQAANPLTQTMFKSMGLDGDQIAKINEAAGLLDKTNKGMADIFNSAAAGSPLPGTDEGRLQAVLNPEQTAIVQRYGKAAGAGQTIDTDKMFAELKAVAEKQIKDGTADAQARIAYFGRASIASGIKDNLSGDITLANANTTEAVNKLGDAGTRAALKINGLEQAAANTARGLEDLFMNSALNAHGKQLEGLVDGVRTGLLTTNDGIRSLQGWPQTVAVISESFLAIAGVVGAASVVIKGFSTVMSAVNMARGVSSAASAAGGASTGGTFISRLLGRGGAAAAGEAGAAGGASLLGPAALVLGGLAVGVGGGVAGSHIIGKRAGESFLGTGDKEKGFVGSRSNGYLTSMLAGAGGGALVGSAFGGIGAIPGAVLGGALGLGSALYSDWDNISGKNPADASRDPRTQAALQQQMSKQDALADATGNRTPGMLTPYQMNQRLMEAGERAAGLLQNIKDNSDQQVDLLRQELSMTRSYGERMTRLLEETSRNTRQIADHSA